ncbi:MAG: hypothetical protein PHQ43_01225 [Dehalococcoidales bacterium]|nr:hypothetical protein [Dehalococcoidales bacterium]
MKKSSYGLSNSSVSLDDSGFLFTLEDVTYTPQTPATNEPFTVKGKVKLIGLPYVAPVWAVAYVTYPETWWQEILPIIGATKVSEGNIGIGGDFEITFKDGFVREGEFTLDVEIHAGPTMPIDSFTIPPFPPLAEESTTFIVAGEGPSQAEQVEDFNIISYAKGSGTPVTPSNVLELEVGDRCRVKVGGNHKGSAITGTLRVAIWKAGLFDPHDEILYNTKTISIPASEDWQSFETTVDIIITSAVDAGSTYGLYAKISGITGADIYSDFFDDVIEVSAAYGGRILSKWFNYGASTKLSFGTTVNTSGNAYEVGVQYKNTSGATVQMGVKLNVWDPSGDLVLSPSIDWTGMDDNETLSTEYQGGDIDVAGTWTYQMILYADGTDSENVCATVSGTLFIAREEVVTYSGRILSKWFNYGASTKLSFGTTVNTSGNAYEVGVQYKNTSGATVQMGVKLNVWNPNGNLVLSPAIDWTGMDDNETLSTEYQGGDIDVAGTWTYQMILYAGGTNPENVCATISGTLFVAQEEVVTYSGIILNKWFNYGASTRLSFGTIVNTSSNAYEVGVQYRNTSSTTVQMGVKLNVWDPSGDLVLSPAIDWTGMDRNETLSTEYQGGDIDVAGTWTYQMILYADGTNPENVCATVSGTIFIAKIANNPAALSSINIPTNVPAGYTVITQIQVTNESTSTKNVWVTGNVFSNGTSIKELYWYGLDLGAGVSFWYNDNFVMPNNNVRIEIYSWYWDGSNWQPADSAVVYVNLS